MVMRNESTNSVYLKSLLVFSICLLMLSGCDSSSKDYNVAISAYESGDYFLAISMFEDLGDYKDSPDLLSEAIQKYAAQCIDRLGEQISDESDIQELADICSSMSKEDFEMVSNSDQFESLLEEYINSNNQKLQVDSSMQILESLGMISDECIESCLVSCGRWGSVTVAEDYIKPKLKSPRSYYRNQASVTSPHGESDEYSYSVSVTLDYEAANSLGGVARNKTTILVDFVIDIDSCTVSYDCKGDVLDQIKDALETIG